MPYIKALKIGSLVTVWHKDPERGSREDSCDWTNHRGTRTRWWHLHPRWHVHHWRIRVDVLRALRRWLFERCAWCGGRYHWNAGVIGVHWPTSATMHPRCHGEYQRHQQAVFEARMRERDVTERLFNLANKPPWSGPDGESESEVVN